jgi:NUMOD3 motif
MKLFYVYVMFRPDGRPCYVGKGKGNRYRQMYRYYNPHLQRIIRDAGGRLYSLKVVECSEPEALEYERMLIAALGRERFGGILVNDTDGGDGKSGWVPSEATRRRIGKSNTGKKMSPEARAKMSASRKGKPKSAEWRAKIGRPGKVMSEESKAKMRASAAVRWARPGERQKIANYHANLSEEQRSARALKISIATREAMKT